MTGLIGNPVEHSISPQLHNTLCKLLNIDMVYLPFCVPPKNLIKAIEGLRAINILGFNVTVPHKVEIIKLLDSISEEARIMGAVNTVKLTNGKLYGFNTDGQGFIKALQDEKFDVKGVNAVILGAGGAARAVAVKLAQAGADKIVILNRSKEKAEILADLVNTHIKNVSIYDEITADALLKYCGGCDIIINATPIGMWPQTSSSHVENPDIFRNKPFVYDLIYNPVKTKFLASAEENSCHILNGMGMLIYQGISAFEIWNEINIPKNVIEKIFKNFNEYFQFNKGI